MRIESVHAILLIHGAYALQLRDDKPHIAGPGLWGLFGGTLKTGEVPEVGLLRELEEELGITLSQCRLFCAFDGTSEFSSAPKRWHFFEVDASDIWQGHTLREGQAAGVFAFPEIANLSMTPMTRQILSDHHSLAEVSQSVVRRVVEHLGHGQQPVGK